MAVAHPRIAAGPCAALIGRHPSWILISNDTLLGVPPAGATAEWVLVA